MKMAVWESPVYLLEARNRGPLSLTDARGWLLGRGGLMIGWRLLPVAALVGSISFALVSLPSSFHQNVCEMVCWLTPVLTSALVMLVGTALKTGGDWQQGRAEGEVLTLLDRTTLVGGKVWGQAFPVAVALTVGSVVAGILWKLSHLAGIGIPVFAPLEGVLLVIETWTVLFLMASVGVWAGNQTRRAWSALALALAVGVPLLAAILGGIILTFDRALLGGHLMVLGATWFAGSVFHSLAERKVK